ncbi:MAG: glycosyltransferase [Crocinitomicaceae bacterium]
MMKKVILVGVSHPFRGGLASYNERLIEEFNKYGDETEIVTFTLQYPKFLFPGKTQYSSSPKPSHLKISERVNSINPLNWLKVGRQLKKEQPDLLILKYWLPFMGPCLGTIARIVKKNKHTKVICVIDNIIPHEKRPGDKIFTKYFVKPVDAFVAMSKSVLSDLKQFNVDKPALFSPHPIFDNFGEKISREDALERLGLNSDQNYVLFFGIIRDYKGLDLLLQAFSNDQFPELNVKLIVAGEFYANEQTYIDLIKELKLEEHVILINEFIANEDVKNYFCAADILAQPYKTATQSGVTQIGYHFEKPMLVTDVGGLSEIIPHDKAGYVVQPNPSDIRNALLDFFQNSRKAEMTQNICIEKEKYSWDKMVNTVNHLFDKI